MAKRPPLMQGTRSVPSSSQLNCKRQSNIIFTSQNEGFWKGSSDIQKWKNKGLLANILLWTMRALNPRSNSPQNGLTLIFLFIFCLMWTIFSNFRGENIKQKLKSTQINTRLWSGGAHCHIVDLPCIALVPNKEIRELRTSRGSEG